MSEPILHIYEDGDQFFAALPQFLDLQASRVVWLESEEVQAMLAILKDKRPVEAMDRHGAKTWVVYPNDANFARLDIARWVAMLYAAPMRAR